jgi:adenine phosphoribosyltransferase
MDFIKDAIRTIPDYPKPGIQFRDVTTLLKDARAFRAAIDAMVQPWAGAKIDKVAGIEARGFILGGAVAHQLSVGFTPVRKKGKLPSRTLSEEYELEYGTDVVEIHTDAVAETERVLLVDDLIATGGTAEASIKLLRRAGADVVGATFVIDLPDLGGARRVEDLGVPCASLVSFDGE